ncbi:MAG: winged helix-turn-helix transcriptional regulator [Proteobacteria bacterium]|nr:winged helix-turn-helix transcriptional regulator [Pseudomonadota bacterium]HQR04033.1 metalloregulator ArsR/SmtB family transcription factor [Rhodocyclaceae bacterium]
MENLSDLALQQIAQYFQVLAEPTRLRILNSLREEQRSVGELAEICQCSLANVSRHLSQLAKQGLVARESQGTTAFYGIADPAVYELCDLVCGNIDRHFRLQAKTQRAFAAVQRRKS